MSRGLADGAFDFGLEFLLDFTPPSLVELVLAGRNVFITGVAGTGKSTVLRVIKDQLRRAGKRYQVLAPTGIAATALTLSAYTWMVRRHMPSRHTLTVSPPEPVMIRPSGAAATQVTT